VVCGLLPSSGFIGFGLAFRSWLSAGSLAGIRSARFHPFVLLCDQELAFRIADQELGLVSGFIGFALLLSPLADQVWRCCWLSGAGFSVPQISVSVPRFSIIFFAVTE
jgi:hypothetical protein